MEMGQMQQMLVAEHIHELQREAAALRAERTGRMSDIGRYRKLYTRLWLHLGFVALTDAEKVVALYLLTGP